MNFTYAIEYQNKQTRTVTVLYTPGDERALSTVRVLSYQEGWDADELRKWILAQAPLDEWQSAINAVTTLPLGVFTATAEDVSAAMLALKPTKTLESVRETKLIWVDRARLQAEASGFVFEFPNATNDIVQVRNERDKGNITGLVSSALILKSQGIVEPALAFRAESNTTYNLTPDQILSLGLATSSFISTLYEKAWSLKEAIHAATTTEDLDGIIWV